MPCRCDFEEYKFIDPEPHEPNKKALANQVSSLNGELSKLGKKYNELKKECDSVTQLLCYSSGIFREHPEIEVDKRLMDWMTKHDEWDMKRTLDTFKTVWPRGSVTKEGARNYFINEAEKVHPLSNWHRTVFFDKVWNEFEAATKKIDELECLKKRVAELEAEIYGKRK